ncbi:putative protein phosphatase 2C 60, partial [Fragariocoptes setiger]
MGAYLSKPVDQPHSIDGYSKTLSYAASSMQGWRSANEDAHSCILDYDEGTSFFAVFDGHGGAEVAIYSASKLPGFIKNHPLYKSDDLPKALQEAFIDFDDSLRKPEVPGKDSGCTAVVALFKNDTLHVANAGDSRCVLCRNGTAVDMSADHKPEDDIEKERISKAGGKISEDGRVNGGLNLSRAIGDHSYKTNQNLTSREQMITAFPDIQSCKINPETDEFVILACDGIWNSMTSQEVVDFVRDRIDKTDKLSQICEELFRACLAENTTGDGTGCDNMTCIIVRTKKPQEIINSPEDPIVEPTPQEQQKNDDEVKTNGDSAKRKSEDGGDEDVGSKRVNVGPQLSVHFPRFSSSQAAEAILTGAQVINKISQAETNLNYCRTPDNQPGECSDIRKCFSIMLDRNVLKQSVCLRNLIIPAVCCPIRTKASANPKQSSTAMLSSLNPTNIKMANPTSLIPVRQNSTLSSWSMISKGSPHVRKPSISAPPSRPVGLIIRNVPPRATQSPSFISPTKKNDFNNKTIESNSTSFWTSAVETISDFILKNPPKSNDTNQASTQTKNSTVHLYEFLAARNNNTCGESSFTRTSRIVGGNDSKLGQWPWMTAIYLHKNPNENSEFWCGGALIDNRHVLTAAHCLTDVRGNRYTPEQISIRIGGVDLTKGTELPLGSQSLGAEIDQTLKARDAHAISLARDGVDLESGNIDETLVESQSSWFRQGTSTNDEFKEKLSRKVGLFKTYKVASIKSHSKFQRHGFYNDIGLIELAETVAIDDNIQRVCVPMDSDRSRDFAGYMATVLGWGTLSYGGQSAKALQQVTMPVWTNKDCDDRYLQPIGKTFMCAGFLSGGKDACQGDSGGPLLINDSKGRWFLHGVVSFGKTCAQAGYPGVYTRVSEYLDWIRDNINSEKPKQ